MSEVIFPMIKVSRLFTYPIKSLAGVELSESTLTNRGLKYDRRWLLVDENGVFLSQRTHPELILFKVAIHENGLSISLNADKIHIPFVPNSSEKRKAKVWDDEMEVLKVSTETSKWFSDKLEKKVSLVYQPDETIRKIDPRYATSDQQQVSAADGYPVLIISEESLNVLNNKLDHPVEMERFRPNIVVKGVLTAHDEDEWEKLTIGETSLVGVKNCARCIMITNNIKNGTLGKEPLRTLASYRKEGKKVLFGRNFIPISLGVIAVGDRIEI